MALALSWMNLRRKRFCTARRLILAGPSEVELLEGLEHGEAGLLDVSLARAVLASGGFPFDQAAQEVDVGPLVLRPPAWPGPRSDRCMNCKLEIAQLLVQFIGHRLGVFVLAHGLSPGSGAESVA